MASARAVARQMPMVTLMAASIVREVVAADRYAVRTVTPRFKQLAGILWIAIALLTSSAAHAQIKAQLPPGPITPAWDKGIQPISRDSYYNAIECGKQGGTRPPCVFYDADLCKNDDFVLTFFTPYKYVAYNVWDAVRRKQPPPTPDYGAAQRTRITLGVTPVKGSKNPIAGVSIKRGGRAIEPATKSVDANGGQFIFDFAAFAPTSGITIELAGRSATRTCTIDQAVLKTFR
jgi:hypothetical protein